ncbi:creatinine amidohydrolase [Synechococcus sp. SYN20]|nr:creatinine amidohydrolase [Synechococcus sp. SYN20]
MQQSRSTVVWPMGAFEQHGPHLPLATDALFAEQILDTVLSQLAPHAPIWSLPSQSIGFSPEHSGFPGTLSLTSGLLTQLIIEVGTQLCGQGVKRLVLFNAHGGQIGLLQAAARELRVQSPSMAILPCFLWSGVPGLDALIPGDELRGGLHAAQAETSLMLALEPELVGDARPVDGDHRQPSSLATPPPGWSLEGAAPTAWLTTDLSTSGVIGDSRAASAECGEALERCLVSHWLNLFGSLLASEWPPSQPVAVSN